MFYKSSTLQLRLIAMDRPLIHLFHTQLSKRLLNHMLLWTFKYTNTGNKTTGASSYIVMDISASEHCEIRYFISYIFCPCIECSQVFSLFKSALEKWTENYQLETIACYSLENVQAQVNYLPPWICHCVWQLAHISSYDYALILMMNKLYKC